MTAADVNWSDPKSIEAFVLWCITWDCPQHFYRTWPWRMVRAEVMALDRNECQLCKAQGKYTKAKVAHHVNHLRQRPDLALDIFFTDRFGKERRNIIAVCFDCHEAEHKRLDALHAQKNQPVTIERW